MHYLYVLVVLIICMYQMCVPVVCPICPNLGRLWHSYKIGGLSHRRQVTRRDRSLPPFNFNFFFKLEDRNVQFLFFADDLMLVAEKEEDVESNLRILDGVMAKWQMKINWGKT